MEVFLAFPIQNLPLPRLFFHFDPGMWKLRSTQDLPGSLPPECQDLLNGGLRSKPQTAKASFASPGLEPAGKATSK